MNRSVFHVLSLLEAAGLPAGLGVAPRMEATTYYYATRPGAEGGTGC